MTIVLIQPSPLLVMFIPKNKYNKPRTRGENDQEYPLLLLYVLIFLNSGTARNLLNTALQNGMILDHSSCWKCFRLRYAHILSNNPNDPIDQKINCFGVTMFE